MMWEKSIRTGCVSAMAMTFTALILPQSAAASNCIWAGGSGNFNNKDKWANCRPGKDDNAEIGVSWINPPTGNADVTNDQKLHNLYLNPGSSINLYLALEIYGNNFYNGGTFNLFNNGIQPYFRSYSKNLQIYGAGTINIYGAKMSGNITYNAGQFVRGYGIIGEEADRLFNDGTMQADVAGQELYFARSIDGLGTFRSQNGGRLHFTGGDSSGDYLINNGLVQLDGVNFIVAKDYSGSFFRTGNEFDARRTVQGTGQILAADARQVVTGPALTGNVINFGAMRVGGAALTSLTVTNTGGLTTLRGAVQSNGAPNVTVSGADFVLGAGGASNTASLRFSGTTSGFFFSQTIDVVNNFSNVADDHFLVSAHVYAPAVASLSSSFVDFGTVRKGTAGVFAGTSIGNTAFGALTDSLRTSIGAIPGNVSLVSAPGLLGSGAYGDITFGLNTNSVGYVGGFTTVGLTSTNSEMADLSLVSKFIGFSGLVTDPAVAQLFVQSGTGWLGGGDGLYTLDLGSISQGGYGISTEFGVLNGVFNSIFAETLGGSFTLEGDEGFSFSGDPFSGLAGGVSDIGNWLRFDTKGLAAGIYSSTLTFNGYSHYAGLDDLSLAPIKVTISATVASVPEPASWMMMIMGFGAIGMAFRGRPRNASFVLA